MGCDMCGAGQAPLKAVVEGVEMQVCKSCVKYGKTLREPRQPRYRKRSFRPKEEKDSSYTVVGDYAARIKQAREKKNLKQIEFAKFLNVRESILQKIEAGKQRPSIGLAKKLQRQLGIKLIEEDGEVETEQVVVKSKGPLTIGDLLQQAMKK